MHTSNRAEFLSTPGEPHLRTVINITVAVEPELYRQTRKIAADYDSTGTEMARFLLLALPEAVKAAHYPGGRPQFGLAAARTARAAASATPATPAITPSPGKSEISPCTPVNANNEVSIQQLAKLEQAPVQNKYPSISSFKSIILKALHIIPYIARFNRCTPVKSPAGYAEI